ncbi:MAG: ABC transporter permease [Roseburia sp.]|nr:ABC transporter permease [Roseburia sp.]
MTGGLELKKIKRTGFVPAFLVGGFLAACIPVLQTAVRREVFIHLEGKPVKILMDANWQMMAMLNILLIVAGACLLYHMEYADNAIQRMCTLPLKESRMFFGKFILMCFICLGMIVIEGLGAAFCALYWFEPLAGQVWEVAKNFGYGFVLLVPAVLLALLISSACKNMWISLGIGVICVFVASMFPTDHFALSLFPFAMPFQIFAGTAKTTLQSYLMAAAAESVAGIGVSILFLKVRRLLA